MKATLKTLLGALAAFARCRLVAWAEFGPGYDVPGLTAAASLNNHQYGVVRISAANKVNIASEVNVAGPTKTAFGVLQNKPYVDEPAAVRVFGLSKVIAGGTITNGAYVSYNSSGHVIDAVSGDVTIGRALEAATTALEYATVLLMPPVRAGSVV